VKVSQNIFFAVAAFLLGLIARELLKVATDYFGPYGGDFDRPLEAIAVDILLVAAPIFFGLAAVVALIDSVSPASAAPNPSTREGDVEHPSDTWSAGSRG
jgi:hypothetical protein